MAAASRAGRAVAALRPSRQASQFQAGALRRPTFCRADRGDESQRATLGSGPAALASGCTAKARKSGPIERQAPRSGSPRPDRARVGLDQRAGGLFGQLASPDAAPAQPAGTAWREPDPDPRVGGFRAAAGGAHQDPAGRAGQRLSVDTRVHLGALHRSRAQERPRDGRPAQDPRHLRAVGPRGLERSGAPRQLRLARGVLAPASQLADSGGQCGPSL